MPIILIAIAAFVVWPRYDLQLQTNAGHWYVAEENILTLDACRESAAKRARYSYACMECRSGPSGQTNGPSTTQSIRRGL